MRIRKSGRKAMMLEGIMTDNVVTADAASFLSIANKSRKEIESVKFEPPKIGGKGFGYFRVRMKTRHYEAQ
ncbi:hypothetical protein [Klebsiella pneumoniae]|uniref:hypothetical protein n=1 Tax=Klebsiella pneumoniae TaxID=573 RepID=UPI001D197137|nr:hypothetical protein [Klebsiella pneumoniae]